MRGGCAGAAIRPAFCSHERTSLTRAYFPHTSVLPLLKRAQVLQDLGFNFMRVYVAWQGVMPTLGAINTTYLDQVEQVPGYKLEPL